MIRTPEGDLEQELRDPEYVKLYGASDAKAEIAITLAEARHAAKKTQKEIADAMSLGQPYVASLEGGEANTTIGTIGSLLAVMGFRLVARTAPLKPEPVRPFQGLVWVVGAAETTDAESYLRTYRGIQESSLAFSPYITVPVSTKPVAGTIPLWPVKSEPAEAVGGAAR